MSRLVHLGMGVLLLLGGQGCAGVGSHVGAQPSPSPDTSTVSSAAPTVSPSSPAARAGAGWRIGPGMVRVSLQLVAGAPDGVFGVEVSGNGPPFRSFRVLRIDPVTLHLTRTGVIAGAPGGLSVDAHTVYVGVTGARAVLRWHSRDLTRLRSWRDPLGVLRGPLAATRSGLWVADRHGLTRLLGDDDAAGDSADRFPPSILMRSAWDAPDLIGNAFWVTALDGHGCPGLYQGSDPNGLGGSPVAALHPVDCGLGFGSLASGPAGTVVSDVIGLMAGSHVLRLNPTSGGWVVRSGPGGSNGIVASAAGRQLFVADVHWLWCFSGTGTVLATLRLRDDQGLPAIVAGGDKDFVVFSEGQDGTATGPRVQPLIAPPACG